MKATLTDSGNNGPGLFRLSTEIVIFAVRGEALQVLCRPGGESPSGRTEWTLPGAGVDESFPLDDGAAWLIAGQTGIHDVYLEQLYTFGPEGPDAASPSVSVAYYALVSCDRLDGIEIDGRWAWWSASRLPPLSAGRKRIVAAARERLRAKLEYSTIVLQLVPEYFTLSELQKVYEIIHGKCIDKRNFRKRILSLAHIEPTEHRRRNGSHRPARLYRHTQRRAIQYLK